MPFDSADFSPESAKPATNLVRRPVDGVVLICSGRAIPQPPWIFPHDPQSQADYDDWLIEQSRQEALCLDEDLILSRLDDLAAGGLDSEARQLLSDFLFGMLEPEFEARPLPDAALPASPATDIRLKW